MTPGDFIAWEDEDATPLEPPALEVDITDPRIVAELHAPDGTVLLDHLETTEPTTPD